MKIRQRHAMSNTVSIAVIVIVLIIAAAGWAAYAGFPRTTTSVSTTTSTTTVGGSGAVTSTVTSTVTSSVSVSGSASNPIYGQAATCNTPFTVAGFSTPPQTAQWYVVTQTNLAKQYVPTATFTDYTNGAGPTQAMTGGTAQMGYQSDGAFVPAIAKGAAIKLVADTTAISLTWNIVVKAGSPYTTLASLQGKTFGITGQGSPDQTSLAYALKLASGLNWTQGVQYQTASLGSNPSEAAALEAGTIQGIAGSVLTYLPEVINGTFTPVYNFTLPGPNSGLYATTSFIQQHPECVQAVVNAFTAGARMWDQNSTFAFSILNTYDHFTGQAAQVAYGVVKFSLSGSVSISAHQQGVNYLLDSGIISQNISAASYIQGGFAPTIA